MLRTLFGARPLLQERPPERLDIGGVDVGDLAISEMGRDVHALHVLAALAVGLARAAQLESLSQRGRQLVDARNVGAGLWSRRALLGVLHPPELPLGLQRA